jgi:hypothetical protein
VYRCTVWLNKIHFCFTVLWSSRTTVLYSYMCKLCHNIDWWWHAHLLWKLNQQFLGNVSNLVLLVYFCCVWNRHIRKYLSEFTAAFLMDQYLAHIIQKHMIMQQHFHCNRGLHKHSHANTYIRDWVRTAWWISQVPCNKVGNRKWPIIWVR